MAEQARELPQNTDFIEDLGLLVGLEEGCNISASEAHNTVHGLLRQGEIDHTFLVGHEYEPTQKGRVIPLLKTIEIDGYESELVVVRPISERIEETVKKKFLRRVIESTTVTTGYDPLLCVKLGADGYLPLARFALNADSDNCRYIQIGSEMRDDSVVYTALDNNTSRHAVVEAFRTIFKESKGYKGEYRAKKDVKKPVKVNDTAALEMVKGLAQQELETQSESYRDTLEAMLVRRVYEKLAEDPPKRNLFVFSEDNETSIQQSFVKKDILRNCRLKSDHDVSLALLSAAPDQNAILAAVYRGRLAFPAATLIKDSGRIVFHKDSLNIPGEERTDTIKMLLKAVQNEPLFDLPPKNPQEMPTDADELSERISQLRKRTRNMYGGVDISEDEYIYDPKDYRHVVPATYLHKVQRLLREDEGAVEDPYQAGTTEYGVKTTYQELDILFADPGAKPLGHYTNVPPVWLALSRLPRKQHAVEVLLTSLGIIEQATNIIGETTLQEERFIRLVQAMHSRGSAHNATFEEVETGTASAGLDLKTVITNEGTRYTVDIYGKASALKDRDFPQKPQRSISFDITKPVINRAAPSDEEAEMSIARFMNTLQKIKEASPEATGN
jgi:hypothetical protein